MRIWLPSMLAGTLTVMSSIVVATPPTTTPTGPVVREERTVRVAGVDERWRLEWRQPPVSVCGASDAQWYTCPCSGFAFGEGGDLDLVRTREGREVERLGLNQFFDDDYPGEEGQAVLRRWDVRDGDIDARESDELPATVAARPPSEVMRFADYDGDGAATEFLLQTENLPCGKRMTIAVGVSRHRGRLHALGTVAAPSTPLVLRVDHWEALRHARSPVRRIDWPCGDHGSETETEVELQTTPAGISVKVHGSPCSQEARDGSPP